MIYSETNGVAPGIQKVIDCSLLLLSTPPLMARLLKGDPKAINVFWEGDPSDAKDFDLLRGDGHLQLAQDGTPPYLLPPYWMPDTNIRAAVPFWLLKSQDENRKTPYVLAVGAFHPRWSSASLDLYCPIHQHHLVSMYFADPRVDLNNLPEDWPSIEEQKRSLWEIEGRPNLGAPFAPLHPGCKWDESKMCG